jgi:single-stranded-DNA-specific exonuclease
MAFSLNYGWKTRDVDPHLVASIREAFGCGELAATTLVARGYSTPESVQDFLEADFFDAWGDSTTVPGIIDAADGIEAAIRTKKRILVFGDYDVDGLSSAALLTRALREFGADPITLIPNRHEEGYGLTDASVARIVSHEPELVITVDCGISACSEIAIMTTQGIQVIITDHHEPAAELPVDCVLCNPKLNPDSPDVVLAGVGVTLKVVELLSARFDKPEIWRAYTDLAALGTLADLVPLTGRNRALVRDGLSRMNAGLRPGLAALHTSSQAASGSSSNSNVARGGETRLPLAPAKLNTTDLTFSLIPRLNAAGRMGDAQLSLDLLLSDDIRAAFSLAEQLETLNNERRATERSLFEEASAQAALYQQDARVLVLGEAGWHDGVKGIVASRLTKTYGVPAIVFSIEDNQARGSGRTVGAINLFEATEQCADMLERFGGHSAAVGVTLAAADLSAFRTRLEAVIAKEPEENFYPPLLVDASIRLKNLNREAIDELARLEPYGQENPEPVYVAENVFITRVRSVGADCKHLSFTVCDGASEFGAIWFNCSDTEHWLAVGHAIDVAFVPKIETWNGKTFIKLHIKGLFDKNYPEPAGDEASEKPLLFETQPSTEKVAQKSQNLSELAHNDPPAFAKAFVAKTLGKSAELHEAQKETLATLADNQNCLTIMATGRGKSLIFHIEAARQALAHKEASIFVFPLRALINDQAFFLERTFAHFGLKATRLTGEVQGQEREASFEAFGAGESDIILTTPEFLERHAERLSKARSVGLVVIDEAHHIATSSSSFRSAYTNLNTILECFKTATKLAVTATADTETCKSIQESLAIKKCIVDPTMRPNLSLCDYRTLKDRERYVASIVASDEKTLVYVNARDEAQMLARTLRKLLPHEANNVAFYHAGLTTQDRLSVERALRDNEVSCVICTSAFGEGINIPDVRNVVLYHLPFSLIDFVQMSGRAGRDGDLAHIHLVFNRHDASQNNRMLSLSVPTREDLTCVWRVLQEMSYDSFEAPPSEMMNCTAECEDLSPIVSEIVLNLSLCKRGCRLDPRGIVTALCIFEEIGLLERTQLEGKERYTLCQPEQKADLETSLLYLEGLWERGLFEEFRDWAFSAPSEQLAETISRPLTPEVANGEVTVELSVEAAAPSKTATPIKEIEVS